MFIIFVLHQFQPVFYNLLIYCLCTRFFSSITSWAYLYIISKWNSSLFLGKVSSCYSSFRVFNYSNFDWTTAKLSNDANNLYYCFKTFAGIQKWLFIIIDTGEVFSTISYETSYSDFYVFYDNDNFYVSYTSLTTYIKAFYSYKNPTSVCLDVTPVLETNPLETDIGSN